MGDDPNVGARSLDPRSERLGSGRLGPLMVKLSIPGMIGMIILSIHNLVDTLWVSALPDGTEAIAALTVLFPIQMVAGAIGMGIAVGLTSLVSRRLGEQRMREVHLGAGNALLMAGAIGLVLTTVCRSWPGATVRVFGAKPEILDRSIAYLQCIAVAFPFFMVRLSLDGLYRGMGNVITPMWLMGFSALLNAALDPLLIYGVGPFPRMGLRGAAIATATSQISATVISVLYLTLSRGGLRLAASDFAPRLRIIGDIAHVGAPAAGMNCLRSIIGSAFNWVLGGFGPAAIAAYGLSHRVTMLAVSCLGGGVHQALMPIVGYNFGSRNYRRMWHAYRIAALWTSIGGLLIGGTVVASARAILAPFAHEPEMLRLGAVCLRLHMSTFFLVEPQMMAMFALQGMGFGGRAVLITLSRNVLLVVPGLVLLPLFFGATGAFAAQPAADVLSLFITTALMVPVYRKYPPSATADTVPPAQPARQA